MQLNYRQARKIAGNTWPQMNGKALPKISVIVNL